MSALSFAAVDMATSLPRALDALAALGSEGAPLAGGTWIMRSPLRHEAPKRAYVALSRLAELKTVTVEGTSVEIGAGVTHAELAVMLRAYPEFGAVVQAAGRSANPAVRAAATLGGNLCTADFPSADLVPALLSLGAEVDLAARGGSERMGLDRFLALRTALEPGRIVSKVIVARSAARSAHARLPLRKAGDYPVAVFSLSVTRDPAGRIERVRAAFGAVETVARRWTALEDALLGAPLDPDAARAKALGLTEAITGRDGVEAPGWYRVRVLPTLVHRAVLSILADD